MVGEKKSLSFTASNRGTATLTVQVGVGGPFRIVSTSSFFLPPGGSHVGEIRFEPTGPCDCQTEVKFTSNGGNQTPVVRGIAKATAGPRLGVTPTSLDFGSVTVGSAGTLLVDVTNIGGGTLLGGVGTTAPFGLLSGSGVSTGDSFILAAGERKTLRVQFAASALGVTSGVLAFDSNGGKASIPLRGVGAAGAAPQLVASPAILGFSGPQGGPNPAPKTLQLLYSGVGSASWRASADAAWLTLSATSGQTPATITVSANTAGLTPQIYTAAITITAAGVGNSPLTVPVGLSVTEPSATPRLALSPLGQDFGSTPAGTSTERTFAVQNTGTGTLTGTAAATAPFSVVSGGSFSLSAGQTQPVVVRFQPVATGWFPGTLSVSSNAGNASATLTGTGTPPTNQPPVITSFTANPFAVGPGGTSTLSVSASDPEGDSLTYTWSVNGGSLSATTGPGPVIWTAPTTAATYTATVSVTDNKPGHSSVSASVNLTVQSGLPIQPSNLTATSVSSSQINLAWQDNSTNESGFKIERKVFLFGTYSQIATVGANVTTYQDTGLTANTTYTYRVRAYNSVGDSGYSNEASATTGGSPGSFTLSAVSECVGTTPQIRLMWTASAGAYYYQVFRNNVLLDGVSGTSYVDTGVTLGGTYSYVVKAIHSGGQTDSNTATATATCNAPPGPVTLTVIPSCSGNAPENILEWSVWGGQVTFPYEVYRNGALLSTTSVTQYFDIGVTAGSTYSYFVRAKNSAGSADSNTATVTAKSDCAAPVAPTISSITPQSATIGSGNFTLIVSGSNFDSTARILTAIAGQTPGTPWYTPAFVDSSTLHLQVTQSDGGFSFPLGSWPGSYVVQVQKYYPSGYLYSNTVSFWLYNPWPTVTSITGTCRANLNCNPYNGFDVRVNGSGFVNNTSTGGVDSTYILINGQSGANRNLIGQGPVTTQMQLLINGSLIPTPGTYTVTVCNAYTIFAGGTICTTGSLTVTP